MATAAVKEEFYRSAPRTGGAQQVLCLLQMPEVDFVPALPRADQVLLGSAAVSGRTFQEVVEEVLEKREAGPLKPEEAKKRLEETYHRFYLDEEERIATVCARLDELAATGQPLPTPWRVPSRTAPKVSNASARRRRMRDRERAGASNDEEEERKSETPTKTANKDMDAKGKVSKDRSKANGNKKSGWKKGFML